MIDVTMRAEDDVHRLRLDARLRQAAEKAVPLAPMELPNKRTLLLLTDATVDQDRSLSCAKRKGLDREGQLSPRAVQVVRLEQGTRRFVSATIPGRKLVIGSSNRSISTTTSTALSPARNRIS